jgi:hypothetical protein
MEEEPGSAAIKLIQSYPLDDPNEGTILIYKVEPRPVEEGMRIEEFYIVTLDNHVMEITWGCGSTPKDAIVSAIIEWERIGAEIGENPFQKVRDQLGQKGEKDD